MSYGRCFYLKQIKSELCVDQRSWRSKPQVNGRPALQYILSLHSLSLIIVCLFLVQNIFILFIF